MNRDRLLNERVARLFFGSTVKRARKKRLRSDEHFTVDGTLIESYASLKSFRPKDKSDEDPESFYGKKRENDTHVSVTDPESRPYRKGSGKEARLCYIRHVLRENRNGLVCDIEVTPATGTAEVDAAEIMLGRRGPPVRNGERAERTRDTIPTALYRSPETTDLPPPRSGEEVQRCRRFPHYPSHRLPLQSTETKAAGRVFRLGQERRTAEEDET